MGNTVESIGALLYCAKPNDNSLAKYHLASFNIKARI